MDWPITLNDYEDGIGQSTDSKMEETLEAELVTIKQIIADPSTCWEPLDEEDEEYIHDTMKAWGLIGD